MRYLQFTWYDAFFPEYVNEAPTSGYANQWNQVSMSTHGDSDHKVRKDGVLGEASVTTYTWQ